MACKNFSVYFKGDEKASNFNERNFHESIITEPHSTFSMLASADIIIIFRDKSCLRF